MIKHIGKHGEKKVVLAYRILPGEDHMCLVIYSDLLPRLIHDELMKTLESAPGQQSDNLADALFRVTMADGRNMLEVIHKEGFMKKVPTAQVIMQPTSQAKIRLDELNTLLGEMSKGEEAVKKMRELDDASGLQKKDRTDKTVTESKDSKAATALPPLQAGLNDVLTDEVIAAQQIAQATRMRSEAQSLLAEAARLEQEAAILVPAAPVAKKKVVKATAKVKVAIAEAAPARKPGRPRGTKNDAAKKNT